MKFNINKKLKIVLISILVILIGTTTFLLYGNINNPQYQDETTTLYNYNNKALVNYEVFLNPNILYQKTSLGEGEIYISEFVDYIKTTFNYEFSGDKEATIQGDYSIVANVAGTIKGEEKNDIIVWQKDFSVLSKKTFKVKDKKLAIKENVSLRVEEYNEFAKAVIEASKVNSNVSLNVVMNINLQGTTDKGSIEEKLSPSIVIPLNTSMFQITGNTNLEKPGAIEETKQVQLPVNKNKVIIYGIIIGILLIILILLIFFTKEASIKDPLEKKLRMIFKKHGDRLVALSNNLAITNININQVKSIDDLVKIADEIGKPIMYKYSKDYKDINKFYLINEDQAYVLELNEMSYKVESKIES